MFITWNCGWCIIFLDMDFFDCVTSTNFFVVVEAHEEGQWQSPKNDLLLTLPTHVFI